MKEIIKLRGKINKIYREIIKLLRRRFELSRKIGDYKRKNNLEIRDLDRESEIINKRVRESKKMQK